MSACDFDECDGSGFLFEEATNTARDCRCRPLRLGRARARRLEAQLPKRYRGVGFDREPIAGMPSAVLHPVKEYTRDLAENLDKGKGIWFVGDVGTGKTTLAMLVSRLAIQAGRSVAIYSTPRLLTLVREAIDAEGGVARLLDQLTSVDLLHLDDLGAERQTDWVLEQLYTLVNTRYEQELPLVITTNLLPDALSDQIGERTVSRIIEICGDPLPLFGHDRRREYRPAG